MLQLALAVLAGSPAIVQAQEHPDSIVREIEYRVFSAALNHIHSQIPTDTFYVRDSTTAVLTLGPREGVPRWLAEMSSVTPDMIESYIARNSVRLGLSPERLITDRPIKLTTVTKGRVTITLSRVGFNADLTEAVLHTIRRCGPRCGRGFIMRFSYVDGEWIVRPGLSTFTM